MAKEGMSRRRREWQGKGAGGEFATFFLFAHGWQTRQRASLKGSGRPASARYPEFVAVLEEWLTVFRPRIPGADTSPFVFLTQVGRPFTPAALRVETAHAVAQRTGVRFFPHMIRSIWATEYLEAKETRGDFAGAATMLGDTINMVIRTYYHVTVEEHQERGAAFVHTQALGKG